MIKEAFGVADTIEEAQEAALLELGVSEDADVNFDIIDMPKKKVLGIFGGSRAKVRAFIELPDQEKKPARKKETAKKTDKKEKQPKAEKPAVVKENKTEEAKPERKPDPVYSEPVDAAEIDAASPAGKAVAYVSKLLAGLNCGEITIKVALREGGAKLILTGEDLGVVIGRRGETLDALQYLASLAAGNAGGYFKVAIDIGNYREKREKALISLAKRISSQVLRNGRSRSLEPMNPYERRIIHTAVQEIEGVNSSSIGEGSNRRVVISPVDGGRRPARKGGYSKKPDAVSDTPAREPRKDSTDLPLYGKIK